MQVRSNKIKDIREHYTLMIGEIYPSEEAASMFDLLLESLLGISRVERAANPALRISESEILKIHFAVKELIKHRPVQYVLGEAWFCDLRLFVDERVLIPRPETEELVEWIVETYGNKHPAAVLDIGTGSGCIALALKNAFPAAEVFALDISPAALNVVRINAERTQLELNLVQADITDVSAMYQLPQFEVIVSNPPYVTHAEKSAMRKNVLDFEPGQALFVEDNDPLIFYRDIAALASQRLKPDGMLFLEINERFGRQTQDLLRQSGFKHTQLRKDLSGKDRMIRAGF
ncbi:MAG: peptide chain release factor N(5)-glutamine methyltransferase [Bacteroidales bacterium]